jgi:hypothetical protein
MSNDVPVTTGPGCAQTIAKLTWVYGQSAVVLHSQPLVRSRFVDILEACKDFVSPQGTIVPSCSGLVLQEIAYLVHCYHGTIQAV